MNKFYMMIGLPGSGKSTFINHFYIAQTTLNRNMDLHVASLDDRVMAQAKPGENYQQAWTRCQQSGDLKILEKEMYENATDFIKNHEGHSYCPGIVIWDQTNLTVKSRAAKLKLLDKDYWNIYALYFHVNGEELERRLKNRMSQEGKYIPPHVVENMRGSFEYPNVDEGFNSVIMM